MLIAKVILIVSFFGIFGFISKAWKAGESATCMGGAGVMVLFGILALGCLLVSIISGIFLFFTG